MAVSPNNIPTAHYCTLLHITAHYCTLLHITAHYCTLLHITAHLKVRQNDSYPTNKKLEMKINIKFN